MEADPPSSCCGRPANRVEPVLFGEDGLRSTIGSVRMLIHSCTTCERKWFICACGLVLKKSSPSDIRSHISKRIHCVSMRKRTPTGREQDLNTCSDWTEMDPSLDNPQFSLIDNFQFSYQEISDDSLSDVSCENLGIAFLECNSLANTEPEHPVKRLLSCAETGLCWEVPSCWLDTHPEFSDLIVWYTQLFQKPESAWDLPPSFDLKSFSCMSAIMLFVEIRYLSMHQQDTQFTSSFVECMLSPESDMEWLHALVLASLLEGSEVLDLLCVLGCNECSAAPIRSKSTGDDMIDFLWVVVNAQLRDPRDVLQWEGVLLELSASAVGRGSRKRSRSASTVRFDLVLVLGEAVERLRIVDTVVKGHRSAAASMQRSASGPTDGCLAKRVATSINVEEKHLHSLSNSGAVIAYTLHVLGHMGSSQQPSGDAWWQGCDDDTLALELEQRTEEAGGALALCCMLGVDGTALEGRPVSSGDAVVDVVWVVVRRGLSDRSDQDIWESWLADNSVELQVTPHAPGTRRSTLLGSAST